MGAVTDMRDVNPPAQSPEPAKRTGTAELRLKARRILDSAGKRSPRMTLILAVTTLLTVAVGSYMVASAAYMVSYLLGASIFWSDLIAYSVMGVLTLLAVLPLGASVFRLACLAVLDQKAYSSPVGLELADATPELVQLLYPFTSRRAYGRCMAVGLEAFGWTMLWGGLPALGYGLLAEHFDQLATRGVSTELCGLMTFLAFVACLGVGILMLFLSGRRAGFGFFVFAHPDLPVREVNRYFKGFRRSFVRPFALRMSFTGWILLSILAVLVPFVLHTIPWGLCCAALYGATLERK